MIEYYKWFKALHVVFMVTWFAGLFYLPRLFIYHAEATDQLSRDRFVTMERRLFAIMTIGAVLTLVFGLIILWLLPGLLQQGWLHAKFTLRSPALWPPSRTRRQPVRIKVWAKFVERPRVDPALEIDHLVDRPPEINPSPAIELRRFGCIEAQGVVAVEHPKDEPSLLLANAKWFAAAAYEAIRQAIAQPVVGNAENLNVTAGQPDLFLKLPEHGLFGRLSGMHAALGKLPAPIANAPS